MNEEGSIERVPARIEPGIPTPHREEVFRLFVEGVQDYALFLLDPEGHVASWNKGAERIKGYRAEEIIGRHFSCFYPPEAVERRWPEHELEVAKAEGHFEDEGWRIRKDGTAFWANVVITAIWSEDGRHIGFSKVTRDLTEKKRHEEDLRQSEERFRLLIDGIRDYAIFLLDPNGNVHSWNTGAERIYGYAPAEIIGQHFSSLYPAEDRLRDKPAREMQAARYLGRVEDEGWRMRSDGSSFWANVIITTLYDSNNRVQAFAKITRDMSDQRRLQALEEAGARTTEFLAMLAHELRNPLAPIRNAVAVMQTTKALRESGLEWPAEVIDRQVSLMTRLVDDLLDVSRVTSGKITLQKEPLPLAAIVTRAVEGARPLIDARKQKLEVDVPSGAVLLAGDLTRLSQVLLNLLNNAAKYTPEGGRIRLLARAESGTAVLSVKDNGIGIPADQIPTVFDLFAQGNRGLARSEGGLGIGLTVVRRLVEMHDGTVEVRSEGVGKGTEFIVRLPLLDPAFSQGHSPRLEREIASPTAARRVLVVDDNHDSAESLKLLLLMWGHEVRSAHDGERALATAAEFHPQIVLLDLGLPGIDGFEVAAKLREMAGGADMRILAMTGYGQEEDRRRTREMGFDYHLVKPLEPSELERVLTLFPLLP